MTPMVVIPASDRHAGVLTQVARRSGFETRAVENSWMGDCDGWPVVVTTDSPGFPLETPTGLAPVIAVTGPDRIAPRAAVESSRGCIPWQTLGEDLTWTVQALSDRTGDRDAFCFTLENNPELLPVVVERVRERLSVWPFADSIELVRVTVALSEALDNAMYHGNLGLSSELRAGDGHAWREESHRRRTVAPYCDRRIRFHATFDPSGAVFTIRDEGTGFDLGSHEDCTLSRNLERCSGRGLHLMHVYMDDVEYYGCGNEVRLVKNYPAGRVSRDSGPAEGR